MSSTTDSELRNPLKTQALSVEEAIHQVIGVADQIHRLGYRELEKAGRL